MGLLKKKPKRRAGLRNSSKSQENKFYQKKGFKIFIIALSILMAMGAFGLYRAGHTLSKISGSDESALASLLGVVSNDEVKKEGDGRTNILLLGMRGANIPGGGLLADTMMVLSLKLDENKAALISVPRDLYVKVPDTETRAKVNAVYALGEEAGKKQGLEQTKKILSEITGLNIHYSIAINFTGFKQLIDAVGGIDVNLETPFYEVSQFVKGKECGGEFVLPEGANHLDGETALCYVRARENTSDFDRAKRQQVVLQKLKNKLVSLGTLTDFGKLSGILDAVGENVRSDIPSSEMRSLFDKYVKMQDAQVYQRVFENSEEGMLTVPQDIQGAGYILIPRAGMDDYSKMHEICRDIFTLARQSDVDPVGQYSKPQRKIRTIPVKVTGKLRTSGNLKAKATQKIFKIEIEGSYRGNELVIDLEKLSKAKEEGTVNVKIEDLNIPEGTKVISHTPVKTIVKIEVKKD